LIPANTISGILPPFTGADSTDRANTSPYAASMTDVVLRYGFNAERTAILTGLLDYRATLRSIGVTDGFQWLDGSFVEDVEHIRSRPPGDIDVVTFARPALADRAVWLQLVNVNVALFSPQQTKKTFKCDAYFIDLGKRIETVVSDTAYFFNLFSHQRSTHTWKGMIRVPLISDDANARALI
jgi:hypothetical protein